MPPFLGTFGIQFLDPLIEAFKDLVEASLKDIHS
jgi:hypothetical protein